MSQSKPNFNPVIPPGELMGRVKKIRESYGFIAGDDGRDYFFHWASVKKHSQKDFRQLEMRDRVSFIPQPPRDENANGPRGIEVMYFPEENDNPVSEDTAESDSAEGA